MKNSGWFVLSAVLVGCGGEGDETASKDSSQAFLSPKAWSDWSEPVPVSELNTTAGDGNPCVSNDGLTLYFNSNRTGGFGGNDIYVSRRPGKGDAWGAPENLGSPVNTDADDQGPTLSKDGLVLVFLTNRTGGFGGTDLYVTRRPDSTDDFGWGTPENLGDDVNTSGNEQAPHLQKAGDGGNDTLYFNRGAPPDIYAAPVDKDGATLGPAAALAELNTSVQDAGANVSKDGLEMFFHSNRDAGAGAFDIWYSTRARLDDAWSAPQNLGSPVNTSVGEFSANVSSDGRTLMFTAAERPGGSGGADIWMSSRTPIGNGH